VFHVARDISCGGKMKRNHTDGVWRRDDRINFCQTPRKMVPGLIFMQHFSVPSTVNISQCAAQEIIYRDHTDYLWSKLQPFAVRLGEAAPDDDHTHDHGVLKCTRAIIIVRTYQNTFFSCFESTGTVTSPCFW